MGVGKCHGLIKTFIFEFGISKSQCFKQVFLREAVNLETVARRREF